DMGVAADNVANVFHISRDAQDKFAYESHQKAVRAHQEERFSSEITVFQGNDRDEGPRESLSMRTLSRLRPIFTDNGTVTAGNACGIKDGAAAVLIMSENKCRELVLKPIMTFIDATIAGVDPNQLGIGPIPAVKKLLKRTHLTVKDIDLVEF